MRYDQETKDKVVQFVKDYNEENGRGGQSAAVSKWDLNPITVRSWLDKAGVATPGKTGKKKKPGRRKLKSVSRPALSAGMTQAETLRRMAEIQEQMDALRAEFDALKATIS
ncbi:MAG: hypothetical protein MI807_11225 [Verrucomicrobiales bacterium]|nr:hypothetical protein [Verrucomicrobiales bacterium]